MTYESAGNGAVLTQRTDRESNARASPRHLPSAIREARGLAVVDRDRDEHVDGEGTKAGVTA